MRSDTLSCTIQSVTVPQVHFLHEDTIVETVQKSIEEALIGCNSSRTYFAQALLPGANMPSSSSLDGNQSSSSGNRIV